MFNYPVKLKRDKRVAYLVTCRDLPEMVSNGNSEEQALTKATEQLVNTIASYVEKRRPIPHASVAEKNESIVRLPILIVAKSVLWNTMIETGTRKIDLARLLGAHLPQVDRLIDLKHSSKIETVELAISKLGRSLELSLNRSK